MVQLIMKKHFLLLFFVVFIYGCFSNKNITGKYASISNNDAYQFKSDSTFIYEYKAFHLYKYSTGKWKRIGTNEILLNSYNRDISIPIEVFGINKSETDSININIELQINHGMILSNYKCYIFIDNKLSKIKRCDSLSFIRESSSFRNIYFKFIKEPLQIVSDRVTSPLITNKLEISNRFANENLKMKIVFDDSYFTYMPFNNDTLKVKSKKILTYNSYLKKWQSIPKVNDKENIFFDFK